MQIIPITELTVGGASDFARLTDVALRRVTSRRVALYIAESSKVIARALRAGHIPRSVLLQKQWLADIEPLLADFPDVPVYVASRGARAAHRVQPAPRSLGGD